MKKKIEEVLDNPKLNGLLGNTLVFAGIYVLFMIPTYFLPYIGIAQGMEDAFNAGLQGKEAATPASFYIAKVLQLIALLVLVAITYVRAKMIEKSWLVSLPAIALVFDLVPLLNLIPLVPTILHIVVIIFAVKGKDKVVYAEAPIPVKENE